MEKSLLQAFLAVCVHGQAPKRYLSQYYLVCCVVVDGMPVSIGTNSAAHHAEINALMVASKRGSLCGRTIDIIILRFKKSSGGLSRSRPCHYCLNLLQMLGVRNIYYSLHDGKIVTEKVKEMTSNYITYGLRLRAIHEKKNENDIFCVREMKRNGVTLEAWSYEK